jgi:hypothetical protein
VDFYGDDSVTSSPAAFFGNIVEFCAKFKVARTRHAEAKVKTEKAMQKMLKEKEKEKAKEKEKGVSTQSEEARKEEELVAATEARLKQLELEQDAALAAMQSPRPNDSSLVPEDVFMVRLFHQSQSLQTFV